MIQKVMYPVLQFAVEVDHDIPTENHMKFIEGGVRHQVMLSKNNVLSFGSVDAESQ